MNLRVGFGYDVHELVDGVDFYLGGVKLDHSKGAKGHSDADVLIHAICDALLGAANLGDIGTHFPDTDPKYKDIDSKILLKEVVHKLNDNSFRIVNIDSTVCLQTPKLSPQIPSMKTILSECLGIGEELISIKATTTERLGFVGREEGVSAYSMVLIDKN
ncbi:MAG: 2-C-methyl-D-erythritol 2,4-cyclodiphosphate synthase [Bacteroidetes bacterium]|nr:2-C-methyl-D-erythritol 2,4-cyclodiphosphate synthase [Bacteroidota bacterium]